MKNCLENPMDGGAWRATVHEVAKIGTGLKGLSTHAQLQALKWMNLKCLSSKVKQYNKCIEIPTSMIKS